MSVDFFYRIVHLSTTIIMIGLILTIWIRYVQIEKRTSSKRNKNSHSLLLFSLAFLLWDYNLFDSDYKYEVYTTILVDGLLLAAATYFNDGILLNEGKTKYTAIKALPIVTILLILFSNILINYFPKFLLVGYSLALIFTLFTFTIISIRLFWHYKSRNLTEIGIFSCMLFAGLYISIVFSFIYSEDQLIFAWIKAFFLISTFGLYLVFANLAFNFIQDILNQQYSKIYTGLETQDFTEPTHEKKLISNEEEINKLIANDKIEEAIELLLSTLKNSSMMTSILLLANRLTSINTARLRDTIDYNTYRIDRNKIVDSLIQLVNNSSIRN